jgi:hypothetical protein
MADETIRLVCMRASTHTPYVPGSVRKPCYSCDEDVWVSPASMEIAATLEFVCSECAPYAMEDTGDYRIMPPTEDQLREVRRWL